MLRNQDKTFLNDCHHAQSQKVYFDDAQISAVFLVPLNHGSARHRTSLQRYHSIQLALAYHHPSGVLTEMPRQVLNTHAELKKLVDMRVLDIEPCMEKRMLQG